MKPIWIWMFPLLVLALALYIAWRSWPWWEQPPHYDAFDKWAPLVAGCLFTVVAALGAGALGYGLSVWIGSGAAQVWHQSWTGRMVSMRSADGVNGSISGGIFMMAGHIGSEQVYYYYTGNSNGSYAPHHWRPTGDTSIFEEDRTDGEVVQFDIVFKRPWLDWIAIPGQDRYRMDFHIPKGSLKKTFSVE